MKKVSVLIPIFNEKDSVMPLLDQVEEALLLLPSDLAKEVIIVDDGSTDGTADILEQHARGFNIIHHDKNRGLSAAMDTAVKACTGDIIIIQHSDLEYPPYCWPDFVKPICDGEADMVAGSRLLKRDNSYCKLSYKLGGMFITQFLNALFFTRFTDTITAARAFRRELIDAIQFSGKGFSFEVEITAKALRHGFRIKEVPTDFRSRSFDQGKKIRWHHIFDILAIIFKSRFFYHVPARAIINKKSS